MKVSQLVTMGIQVIMDRTLANKITLETPIAIHPDPSISVFGIGRWDSILPDDGIIFLVVNYKAETDVSVSGKKVSVINFIHPILPFGCREAT